VCEKSKRARTLRMIRTLRNLGYLQTRHKEAIFDAQAP
jgi:hypothetical protein